MNRILVLGSNGLLGQAIQLAFNKDYQVYASSVEDHSFLASEQARYIQADLTSRAEVRELVIWANPDVIINTAAYTNVDGCEQEREQCWAVNVLALENIIEAPYIKKPILVQISTDYVFDGEKGAYRETDIPNPRGNYARSKMAAENIISSSEFEYIIARTQVLYGTGVNVRANFVTWLVQALGEQNTVQIVDDQIGNPTYTPDLAEAVLRLLEAKAFGVYHISGIDRISRYDFATLVSEVFGLDTGLIQKIHTEELQQKAPRPMNSTFSTDKLYNNINWLPRPTEKALKHLKAEMEKVK